MAIVALPSGIVFVTSWRPVARVQVNRSAWNSRRRVLDLDNAHFTVTASILPVAREVDKRKVRGFYAQLKGPANTFRLPVCVSPQGVGDLTATATASAGANSMSVSGTAGQTVSAGDYLTAIATAGVEQLLTATADVTLGGGTGSVTFEPALRDSIGSGDTILVNQPTGLVALVPSTAAPEEVEGVLTWAFEAEEAF